MIRRPFIMGGKKTLLASGALVGLCAILLTYLGNPANMGFCIACFIRDIAGMLYVKNNNPSHRRYNVLNAHR